MKMTAKIWEMKIREARGLYLKLEHNRFKIAGLALSACDMRHGGDRDRRFTVKRFSQAIGIFHKTLYEWIKVKTLVVDKLTVREDLKSIPYHVLTSVRERVNKESSPKQVRIILNEELGRDPKIFKWRKYDEVLQTILNNANTPIKLMEIPDDVLISAIQKSGMICTLLRKEMEFRKQGSSGAEAKVKRGMKKFKDGVAAAGKITSGPQS